MEKLNEQAVSSSHTETSEVVENGETYYQLRYTAHANEVLPFKEEWETSEREFVALDNLPDYIKWAKGVTFSAQIDSAKKFWNI